METLSALDALFLRIESSSLHMHIASVGIYEGPLPSREAIIAAIDGKLSLVPRYRQRVRFVPLELGQPVWVDDPDFTLDYHLRFTAVPPPGGEEELCTLAGRLFGLQLDRERPLWEMWVVDGLAGGRWAMIPKTHHSIVDGVGGVDLMSTVLDSDPGAATPPAQAWHPRPAPGSTRLLANALGEGVMDGVEAGRDLVQAALHPLGAAADLLHMGRELNSVAREAPPTSLNGSVGRSRRWQFVRGSLDEAKAIREHFGATINDVVLAAITNGLRDLLISRGEDVTTQVVRTLVPVSVRTQDQRGALNNRVSGLFPELPIAIEDPVERLVAVREQMEALKNAKHAEGGDSIMALGELTPAVLLSVGEHASATLHQHLVQTITTNVPGPRQTMYLAGSRLLEAFPFVPLGPRIRVSIAILSYERALNYGITGDYDTAADISVLGHGIEEGLAQLKRATPARRRGTRTTPAP